MESQYIPCKQPKSGESKAVWNEDEDRNDEYDLTQAPLFEDDIVGDIRSPSPGLDGNVSPIGAGNQSPLDDRYTQDDLAFTAQSPTGAGPGISQFNIAEDTPGSPAGSDYRPGSPRSPLDRPPFSPLGDTPGSPEEDRPNSRSGSEGAARSPISAPIGSPIGSPAQEGPQSPVGSPIGSPALEGPQSPIGSPAQEGPQSPIGSPALEGPQSPIRSPVLEGPQSPIGSPGGSPIPETQTSPTGAGPEEPSSPINPVRSSESPKRPPMSPTSPPQSPQLPAPGDESEGEKDKDVTPHTKRPPKISDDEGDSDKESAVGELIADIFGSSDDEEEFEGFGEADVENVAKVEKKKERLSGEGAADDDDDETEENTTHVPIGDILPDISDEEMEDEVRRDRSEFVSDFEVMMAKKKEENQKRRRRKRDEENITANDDLIDDMIKSMKQTAQDDRVLNDNKKAATNKLRYLPHVMNQLKKADLHSAFIDCGILSAITEWLAPLPDRSLPHLTIREVLLKSLLEFPGVSSNTLKTSGVGKAVMYLCKHPKEIRTNREMAGKLINEWSRPIFNLTSNFKLLSKEEREQRDYEQLPKRRHVSTEGDETPKRDIDHALAGEERALRPGDPGWIMRARVPVPSNKDYVVRPKWNMDEIQRPVVKKKVSRYEKHKRVFADRKKKKVPTATLR